MGAGPGPGARPLLSGSCPFSLSVWPPPCRLQGRTPELEDPSSCSSKSREADKPQSDPPTPCLQIPRGPCLPTMAWLLKYPLGRQEGHRSQRPRPQPASKSRARQSPGPQTPGLGLILTCFSVAAAVTPKDAARNASCGREHRVPRPLALQVTGGWGGGGEQGPESHTAFCRKEGHRGRGVAAPRAGAPQTERQAFQTREPGSCPLSVWAGLRVQTPRTGKGPFQSFVLLWPS